MKIQRGELLAKLNEASPGLTSKPQSEQSDCFVFTKNGIITFNTSVMVRVDNPLDFECAVPAKDLTELIAKMPDDEIDVSFNDGRITVKGGTDRKAWISAMAEIAMPLDQVPQPGKWSKLTDGTAHAMQSAAQACARKDADYLCTVVHVTPELVEGTDSMRFVRVTGPTGFPGDALLPASAVEEMEGMELLKASVSDGWVHFRTGQGAVVSVLSGTGPYIEEVEEGLKLRKPEKVVLPAGLSDAISRCEVFDHGGYDFKIGVSLSDGKLILTAEKEGAGYKERQKIEYTGRPLRFMVNPQFLVEVLEHTREVQVDGTKMKIGWDRNVFVVSLDAADDDGE